MKIKLSGIAKRYRMEWVLRNVNLNFSTPNHYAVTGPNGSGKSTLLRILSGHLTPTKGTLEYTYQNRPLEKSTIYRHLSYAAPYIELIEEFTLHEALLFHQRFKPFRDNLNEEAILDLLAFPKARRKPVRHFSSGMKQRLKLALALCSDTALVLLDEPTTNLDLQGIDWYRHLIDRFAGNRLLIVASNVEVDFAFCEEKVSILDFKKR